MVFTSLDYIDIVTKEKLAFGDAGSFSNFIYTYKIETYKHHSKKTNFKLFVFKPPVTYEILE